MQVWETAEPEPSCDRSRALIRPRKLPLQVRRAGSGCRSWGTPLLSSPSSWRATAAEIVSAPITNPFCGRGARAASAHLFQLVDHARDDRQPAVPEFGILGIEPERLEQFGIMLGATGL